MYDHPHENPLPPVTGDNRLPVRSLRDLFGLAHISKDVQRSMPTLTRVFIKTGLLYFVVALAAWLVVAAQPVLGLPAGVAVLRPVALHLLMVGWVTQLIIGVVFWMFPKESKERPRGSETLGWVVYVLLNSGLVLRVIGEPLVATMPGAGWMLALSAVLQLAASWVFIANTWARVKER